MGDGGSLLEKLDHRRFGRIPNHPVGVLEGINHPRHKAPKL